MFQQDNKVGQKKQLQDGVITPTNGLAHIWNIGVKHFYLEKL